METAKRYYSSTSKLRTTNLPEIQKKNADKKAEEERRKLARKFRADLKDNLKVYTPTLIACREEAEVLLDKLNIKTDDDVNHLKTEIEALKLITSKCVLHPAIDLPPNIERPYKEYRTRLSETEMAIDALEEELTSATKKFQLKDPKKLLEKQMVRNIDQHNQSLDANQKQIVDILDSERQRLANIRLSRRNVVQADSEIIVERFEAGVIDFNRASTELDAVFHDHFSQSRIIYESYQRALEALKGDMDLDYLIRFNMAKSEDLSREVDQLTGLAQLGIAVEITGHEIHDYRSLIASSMDRLPDAVHGTQAFNDIELAVQGLTEQMKFLSPLRLSGQQIRVPVTGEELASYLYDFFKVSLGLLKVKIIPTDAFKAFEVQEFRSRIFPVFINLVNNSIYWTSQSNAPDKREIVLDVIGNEIIISDNGPGVDPLDLDDLFTLFFTRKTAGRGVGLYLAKASLTAGGHSIRYVHESEHMPLQGANFAIKFLGSNLKNG